MAAQTTSSPSLERALVHKDSTSSVSTSDTVVDAEIVRSVLSADHAQPKQSDIKESFVVTTDSSAIFGSTGDHALGLQQ